MENTDKKMIKAQQSNIIDVANAQTIASASLTQVVKTGTAVGNIINPNEIAKNYTEIAKKTENRLIKKADKDIKKLEKLDNLKVDDVTQYKKKVNKTIKQAEKTTKSVQKRNAYVSKNYRKQTIRKELVAKATNEVKTKLESKVKSDLLCVRNEIGKSQLGSNLLCLTDKATNGVKSTIVVSNKILAPTVKGAKILSKGPGRMARGGAALVRQLRIKEIMSAENAGVEVAKTGVLAFTNASISVVANILKAVGKGIIKLLMPLVPYIVLITVPLILVIIGAIAINSLRDDSKNKEGTSSKYEELTPIAGDVRHRVVERAKYYIGQNGQAAWDYCNGGNANEWCCMFVSMCFGMENAISIFNNGSITAGCPVVSAWALNNPELIVYYQNTYTGESVGDKSGGRYGDLILFDWNYGGPRNGVPNHIGIITDYDDETKYYSTIEGNTMGMDCYSTVVTYFPTRITSDSPDLLLIIRPDYNSIEELPDVEMIEN